MTPPDDFEARVAHVVGEALGERRHWLWNRQMLALFGFVVATACLLFYTLDHQFEEFRSAAIRNCENINDGNRKVNDLLDKLAENALTNPSRTPAERVEIASTYTGLRLPISDCPP